MEIRNESRFNYRFSKNFNKEDITRSVAKYGIAVIEDYFSEDELKQLKSEATELLSIKSESRLEKNKSVLQKASINSLDKNKFPMTTTLPKSEFFTYVAKDFFGPYPFIVPLVYIHKDINKIDFIKSRPVIAKPTENKPNVTIKKTKKDITEFKTSSPTGRPA